ncbi:MAG TPA: SBBP repeat-containing protein [Bryobacteraceae bacterium]|nr:SBBP repeat-containing protein [Bryobacteraceae bacterium]
MITRILSVVQFNPARFWTALAWLLVSGWLVQPANAGYGQVPMYFVENRGQFDGHAKYVARGSRLTGYFDATSVVFAVDEASFRLSFPGANPASRLEGMGPSAARVNFLVGAPAQWRTDLPAWDAIAYRAIFPGVDLIYSSTRDRLKSDFIVSPGADPESIRLRYESGAIHLDGAGALVVPAGRSAFREEPPVIYQEIAGERVAVEGAYRLRHDGTVGFRVGPYDHRQPLIIDPALSYSTFLGGNGMGAVTSIAVDGAGNAYLAGWTTSTNLPTVNAVQSQQKGSVDAFVAKLGPGGNSLIYCTYLGGRSDDRAFGIAVDSSGNAYVTGWTGSGAFPVVSPAQSTLAGGKDAFVAKLNPAGNSLIYSTYLGGAGNDSGNGIAVDAAGNAYVAGYTYSSNFPTLSAYQTSNNGTENAFIAKLSSAGTLIYSTYLGGNGSDGAAAIAVDSAGNAYITGGTTSTNFPTASPLQSANGGNQDAFITKLNATGNGLIYSTYLGGSGGAAGSMEAGTAIAVGATGAAYVAGVTNSTNFPVTSGALQPAYTGGGSDAFVAKLSPAGTSLVYSTYLGGSSFDYASGIAVDSFGNAYVTGYTGSSDFWSLRAVQSGNDGLYDAFLTKLNPTGAAILSSTYLGGSGSDSANAVAIDSLGNAFIAGLTQSGDFPLSNPLQTVNGDSYSGFVSKISPGWMAGVFLNGSWYIDRNRNGGYDGPAAGDETFSFGQAGDVPVAGDWTGSGTIKIGVFRGGQWLLDCNGNGVWDGVAGGDCLYTFGQAGDVPVVGDWNGNGKAKIGVFRGGFWMLDVNGNGVWDGTSGGDNGFYLGNAAYKPVVGDWSGSGTSKAGVFLNGTWYLDTTGSGQWDQAAYFGQEGDIPVIGDWSNSGKSYIGVFRNGYWIVDMDGTWTYDGIGTGDSAFWLGNSSFTPVVMR